MKKCILLAIIIGFFVGISFCFYKSNIRLVEDNHELYEYFKENSLVDVNGEINLSEINSIHDNLVSEVKVLFNEDNVLIDDYLIKLDDIKNSNINLKNEMEKKSMEISNLEVEKNELNNQYNVLNNKYNLNSFDLIVALGEARMRNELTLELQAKNISSCSLADNSGVIKKDQVIDNDFEEFIKTRVLLQGLDELVKFSNDAGKFVCNNLYFHLLANYPDKAIFIHIPNCHDDSEEYIKNAVKITKIINKIESRGK